MKRIVFLVFITFIDIEFTHYALRSCPNCVGTVSETSAPFFSDECYQDSSLDGLDTQQTTTEALLNERKKS